MHGGMYRGTQGRRWLPVLLAVLTCAAIAGVHAPTSARTLDRTTHAVAHAAVVPVHLPGAVPDAAAPASGTAPALLLLFVVGTVAAATVRSRRTTRLPARAPPGVQAPSRS